MSRRRNTLIALGTTATLAVSGATVFVTTSAFADSGCDSTLHISHRGAGGLAPENTNAAMALAAENGADVFEVDVQLSEDGKVVVMHDTDLARTTDVEDVFPGREEDPINTFTFEELQQLDAGSWFESRFAGEKVPTLEDVAEYATPDGVGVVLELKDPELNPGLIEAIDAEMKEDSRWDDLIGADQVTFSSFDAAELKKAKELRDSVPTIWVTSEVADDATLEEAATWTDYYGTHFRTLPEGDIDRIEDHGLQSMLYTANSPEHLSAVVDTGVDAVITDFPNVLTAVCEDSEPFPEANGIEITDVDPDGEGQTDLEPEVGEHFVVTNTTDSEVDVSGYFMRDAVANTITIGDGYTIPAGGELRVYTGPGTNTDDKYFADHGTTVLNNNGDSLGLFGSEAELLDVYGY